MGPATLHGQKDTTLYSFSGLLDTLAGVLRDVFGRVSDIAQKMLAHDAMSISVISEDAGLVRIYASSGLGAAPMPFEITLPDHSLLTRPGILSWSKTVLRAHCDSARRPQRGYAVRADHPGSAGRSAARVSEFLRTDEGPLHGLIR